MILIKHRVNKISQLQSTPINLGVEVDLRSYNNSIYLHHDPFIKGDDFDKWLKHFNHKILVLNVKEYGLEDKIKNLLKKYNIKNYFFHDQSFSIIVNQIRKKFRKFSIRFSEYESYQNYLPLLDKIDWVWIDNFNKLPSFKKNIFKYNKVIIVSPELINLRRKSEITKIKKLFIKKEFHFDAVCTKYPDLWQN